MHEAIMREGVFRRVRAGVLALALATVGVAACGGGPTGPDPSWEVIEEVTFAPSLNVDLDSMNRTATGVYWRDLVVGTGPSAVFGTTPTIRYQTWLADGTRVDSGGFPFFMGNNRVLAGLEDGILNQRSGGTRQMVIPPARGYAGQAQYDTLGSVLIPPGSVLIFEVVVDTVR